MFQEHPILSRVESASAAEVGDSAGHFIGCNSTDPLRETRSLDAVAGFLPVKRWVKKSPGEDDGAGE
jgi:hypothetical protein